VAADEAKREGIKGICAIEFGVAEGNGLLALQEYADKVERETNVEIAVYGFDTGRGLPELCGDYRDHPDCWRRGAYPMNYDLLQSKLQPRTQLVIGDVRETAPQFVNQLQ